MNRYIAFLRAVNVGGRVVKMEEIRRILSTEDFSNVTTYIQSGNVIFDSAEKKVATITKKIETTLSESLGYKVSVVIRTIPDIANVIIHLESHRLRNNCMSAFYQMCLMIRM